MSMQPRLHLGQALPGNSLPPLFREGKTKWAYLSMRPPAVCNELGPFRCPYIDVHLTVLLPSKLSCDLSRLASSDSPPIDAVRCRGASGWCEDRQTIPPGQDRWSMNHIVKTAWDTVSADSPDFTGYGDRLPPQGILDASRR